MGDPPVAAAVDGGLQQERTTLAWERTAISMMVAGILLARYAADEAIVPIALLGIAQTIVGGGLLVWAGTHYMDLHGMINDGASPVHPTAARLIGLSTVAFSGLSLVLTVVVLVAQR